jgi:hypothetical protein
MPEKMVTPKFLTAEMADTAIKEALGVARRLFNIEDFCVVVVVPSMKDGTATDFQDWLEYKLEPYVLCVHSEGEVKNWKHPYDDIAKCKALQLWQGRATEEGGTPSHLFFSNDTPWWGGVKRQGIVVAGSGSTCSVDQMVAGIVAGILIALARQAMEKSADIVGKEDFLT